MKRTTDRRMTRATIACVAALALGLSACATTSEQDAETDTTSSQVKDSEFGQGEMPTEVVEEVVEIDIELGTIYFDFDSSEVTYDGQLEINKAVDAASKAAGSQVLLTAHTDTSGSEQYNLDLSARRAKSVVDAMSLIGVGSDRITASAVGESDPAVATGDGVREPKNRRVEIRLAN